ncbi:MAG TPA: hypothetical protein VGD39_13880 [Nocardioides sp.]
MSGVRPRLALPLVVAACSLVLAGCGDGTPPGATPAPGTSAPVPGADSEDTRAAVEDLAASLGVTSADVEVVAVEEVPWNDGSRGCAKPGRMYTMGIVEGARITLRVGATAYEYHSGGPRPPALCETPTE